SPALTTDLHGRVWVAAVAGDGRLLVARGTTDARGLGPFRVAATGSAVTSSPVLAEDPQGGVRLFAVTAAGSLLERHTVGSRADHWSPPHQLGLPGSWSTHAAPAVATDPTGRLWLAAVTRSGGVLTERTVGAAAARWSGFARVDDRTWSVTSTPALAAGDDGRAWLATIDDRGGLSVRHTAPDGGWTADTALAGTWSPYASPSLAVDRTGRVWLAALGQDGVLGVRTAAADPQIWRPAHGLPSGPAPLTMSPTLTGTPDGGVLVGLTDRAHRLLWRRPLGPGTLPPAAHGVRGGGYRGAPLV
ncbi:MAG: hypothetical protein J2P22_18445, partial [Nocardioides sp.]|nr:hypothetical protein [Nocardioides sp.]